MQHLNSGGNQKKLHRERVGRKESLYISFCIFLAFAFLTS